MLTIEIMRKMWPNAPLATRLAVVTSCADVFAEYGLTTPLRVAHFMAQISHECGRGTIVRENMNYSAARLTAIFGVGRHSAKVTEAEAAAIEHHPALIAERVYGLGNPAKAKELGNTRAGDGFLFRGNGMLQLTGGTSHAHIGTLTGFDLYEKPEMLEDPATSFRVAAAEFKALGCIPPADADNVVAVTRRVNGGSNGLAERTVLLRQWKAILPGVDEPAQAPRAAPDPQQISLMSSKIAQGATVTGGLTVVGTAAQVAQYAQTTSDTVSVASGAASQVVTVVQTVKPIFGLMPGVWMGVAIGCGVAALIGCGYVLWKRYRKLVDQGV